VVSKSAPLQNLVFQGASFQLFLLIINRAFLSHLTHFPFKSSRVFLPWLKGQNFCIRESGGEGAGVGWQQQHEIHGLLKEDPARASLRHGGSWVCVPAHLLYLDQKNGLRRSIPSNKTGLPEG
jgi:hypothetical protein